ncbi:SET domain-containing protein SmydA-8 [Phlebotomus argentipes]|uniref:SET domain-containing protein SmydA-8 n=1 Tax=Phlebotomus argentipes TaxID=94469 RepID=UPI00289348E8|nr:SET domain-containing protein SmydA-8 [Phlebotomus argentipes]
MMEPEFEVLRSDTLGRYGVAKRDLKAGEVLHTELPFVVGPKQDTAVACLGCNVYLDGTSAGPRCSQCGWPLCPDCENSDAPLHRTECRLFTQNHVKFQNLPKEAMICLQLDCITPLRLLLAKEADPERWEQELSQMEYHEVARRQTPAWKVDQVNIVQYLRGPCKLSRFPEALIQQVCGILEVNSFEAHTLSGNPVRCIFPKLAIFAHSCVPNLTHSISLDGDFRMVCRAAVDIPQGGMLFTTYTYTLTGTKERQVHLQRGKFFTCHCSRCLDPTELGTYFSSIKCRSCPGGFQLSTDPLDETSDWKCNSCDASTPGSKIHDTVDKIQESVDVLKNKPASRTKLIETEKLFKHLMNTLHPNHFLQISLREMLIEMLGHVEGCGLNGLPEVLLQHKIQLIRDVLAILNAFEPGMTRVRAMMLFELHAPLAVLAKKLFFGGKIPARVFREKLQEIADVVSEAYETLKWEDCRLSEGLLATICQNTHNQLLNDIADIKDV